MMRKKICGWNMIKILKNRAKEKIHGECPVCNSEFTFTTKDLKVKNGVPYKDRYYTFFGILKCPCCKKYLQYDDTTNHFEFIMELNTK